MKIGLRWGERVNRGLLGFQIPVALVLSSRSVVVLLNPPEVSPEVRACDPLRADHGCGDTSICLSGRCERFLLPSRCAVNEVPSGCVCAPGLEDHLGRCRDPSSLTIVPEACADSATWELARTLQGRCARERGDDEAALSSCSTALWQEMSRESPSFDLSLLTLPGALTVHFPRGEPPPPPRRSKLADREVYRKALAGETDALRRAKAIFVIGRASRGGDDVVNEELALRRATMIREILDETLGDARPRTWAWGLASDVVIDPASFKSQLQERRGYGVPGPIAWSADVERRLREALEPEVDLQMLDADDVAWVQDSVNRVVFIVPLFCEGNEFYPPAAFQGADNQGEPDR